MLRLFFRDGSPFTGNTPYTFKPIKGEARVRIYDRKQRRYRNTTVYTAARLDDLNDRRRENKPKGPVSGRVLLEVTHEFKRFIQERDRLITWIYEFAPLSSTLQVYSAKIDNGQVLSPSEIRLALQIVKAL